MARKECKKPPHNVSPILFLQWLDEKDKDEAEKVWAKFHKKVEIQFADAASKDEAITSIKRWLHRNPNAQFLYIAAHGDTKGVGRCSSDRIDWPELWDLLAEHVLRKRPISLWLGACKSSYSAETWSPVQRWAPVKYIVGFPVSIKADQIGKVLKKLIRMTKTDYITYEDEEIRKLRRAVPGTSVLMHHKAKTKEGEMRYVNFDTFRKEVGMTLKQYLELKSSRKGRRP
jgi:hypothetical protein